jgi:hypothetical protein
MYMPAAASAQVCTSWQHCLRDTYNGRRDGRQRCMPRAPFDTMLRGQDFGRRGNKEPCRSAESCDGRGIGIIPVAVDNVTAIYRG